MASVLTKNIKSRKTTLNNIREKIKDVVKFQKSPFPTDTSFEKTLFMAAPIMGEELNQIEKSHGGSLNHWVCGIMHITV